MTRKEYIEHCYFYKGEEDNPYRTEEDGDKSLWWMIEHVGVYPHKNGEEADEKETGKLSEAMRHYIKIKLCDEKFSMGEDEREWEATMREYTEWYQSCYVSGLSKKNNDI